MENVSVFGRMSDVSNLAIHLSWPWSTVSFSHNVKHLDLINENSNLPFICKERISTLKYKTDNIGEILNNFSKDKFKCEQVKITLHGSNLDKYIQLIKQKLNIRLCTDTTDDSTALGCNFLLRNILYEVFEYDNNKNIKFAKENDSNLFPYLLLIINHKIVFIKVSNECTSEKIYETPFDCQFLLKIAKFSSEIMTLEEFFEIARKGSNEELSVEESDDTCQPESTMLDKEGLAIYLLKTLLHNLCDLIILQSKVHNLHKIILGEYFNNEVFLHMFVKCFEKLSANKINVYFMRHNGLATSIGTLVKDNSIPGINNSWWENLSISSGLINGNEGEENHFITSYLAVDNVGNILAPFPHLKQPYRPYTQDLYGNKRIRVYWLDCIHETVKHSVDSRIKTNPNGKLNLTFSTYGQLFTEKVTFLSKHPYAYGPLSFIILQDTILQLKNELGLFNTHYMIKSNEIKAALNYLPTWLAHFDGLATNERHIEIAKSLLAGNMFDWGSKDINQLLLEESLDFKAALNKVSSRPWPKDDLDLWLQRMNEPSHKFAAIFPDNCGFDFILGIIPFARELIKGGTKIVLCVNVEPVINDVTVSEVNYILEEISKICPIISKAYKDNKLFISEQSRSTPCLDFRYVNQEFAELSKDLDLLVIDGMGRSIQTNFDAEFTIECLKVAMIKDKWLSKEITGQELAPIFSYSRAKTH